MGQSDFESRVRRIREDSGVSQGALADAAGLTRQALSAIEAGRAVPSTHVALRLARALGRSVEDLFSLDDTWTAAAAPGVVLDAGDRVALAHVAGRWVAHPLRATQPLAQHTAADALVSRALGSTVTVRPLRPRATIERALVVVGCAPALGVLAARLQDATSAPPVRWIHAASEAALSALAAGSAHVAGAHLLDEATGTFNAPHALSALAGRPALLAHLARWEQGLVVPAGNPLALRTVADLCRPGLRLAHREAGSGARALLGRLLAAVGIPQTALPAGPVVGGHLEVAQAVALGAADAGIATRGAALAHGLGFVPLAEERFDLVVPADLADDPRVGRLIDALGSRPFRDELDSIGGYDTADSGDVRTIGGRP